MTNAQINEIVSIAGDVVNAHFLAIDATYRNDSEDAREQIRTSLDEFMRLLNAIDAGDDVRDIDDRLY